MIDFIYSIKLSDCGSWASILGVIISIITFCIVFAIKKQFLFRSRVEEHSKSLGEISSRISNLLESYSKNQNDIEQEIAIADVKLRTIQKGASGSLLSDVKRTRKKIKRYRWASRLNLGFFKADENSIRRIKTEISVVVEELSNVKKELLVGK